MSSRYFFVVLFAAFLTGCTVKMDMEGCPGFLKLDMSHVDYARLRRDGIDSVFVYVGGEEEAAASIEVSESPDQVWVPVPKGNVEVAVAAGGCFAGERFLQQRGMDYPLLYLYGRQMTMDETAEDVVHLTRESLVLNLAFRQSGEYLLDFIGTCNGFDGAGKEVHEGFDLSVRTDASGRCSVGLPRQRDASLAVSVTRSGRVSSYFKLGRFMAENGYDWDAENLEDYSLVIDYSENKIDFYPVTSAVSYVLNMEI